MIDSFLVYITHEKRYSRHTVTAYATDLGQFSSYLSSCYDNISSLLADYQIIRSWIMYLSESGLEARSINRKIASLKSYYGYLVAHQHLQKDPTLRLRPVKSAKRLPQYVEEHNMVSLLDRISYPEGFEGTRDKLVLELLYGTGIRLSELISLKHTDVDTVGKKIKVTGKGNKQRIIPINQSLHNQIYNYITNKTLFFPQNPSLSFVVTQEGNPVYPMYIYRLVKKYLEMVTTLEKKSPHILRHTFATHLLNKGADLLAIKELLGHTSLAATQVYTHNTIEKLKSVHEKAHPKA